MSDDWPPKPPPPDGDEPDRPSGPGPRGDTEESSLPPRPHDAPDEAFRGGAVPDDDASADEGGPSPNVRALGIAVVAVVVFIVIAALVGGAKPPGSATFPPVGVTVDPAGEMVGLTRGAVIRALSAQGIQAEDAITPYRPAEAPAFATAPRILVRAILPDDPTHGLIVIYQFANASLATAAAKEEATYIASGIGRVQFPNDARFVIRVDGSNVIFFTWSPPSSPDERTPLIETALETVGAGVEVPN